MKQQRNKEYARAQRYMIVTEHRLSGAERWPASARGDRVQDSLLPCVTEVTL